MVKFAWSWKDYDRCKRHEERKGPKGQSAAPVDVSPEPNTVPAEAVDVEPVQAEPVAEQQPEAAPSLKFCKTCGKHVIAACLYGGCPIQ